MSTPGVRGQERDPFYADLSVQHPRTARFLMVVLLVQVLISGAGYVVLLAMGDTSIAVFLPPFVLGVVTVGAAVVPRRLPPWALLLLGVYAIGMLLVPEQRIGASWAQVTFTFACATLIRGAWWAVFTIPNWVAAWILLPDHWDAVDIALQALAYGLMLRVIISLLGRAERRRETAEQERRAAEALTEERRALETAARRVRNVVHDDVLGALRLIVHGDGLRVGPGVGGDLERTRRNAHRAVIAVRELSADRASR